jgi:methylglutaconyl-CoA hydratase
LAGPALTGETFDAAEAHRIGLITHVTDDVPGTVDRLCRAIALGAPGAVAATKRILREVPGADRDTAFEHMRQVSEAMFSAPDAAEGMAAFAEKRPPAWQLTPD